MMSGQPASGGSASFGGSMMYWIGIDQLSVQALFTKCRIIKKTSSFNSSLQNRSKSLLINEISGRTPRKGLSGKPPNGVRPAPCALHGVTAQSPPRPVHFPGVLPGRFVGQKE